MIRNMKDLKELSEKKSESDSQQPPVEQPKPSSAPNNKLKKKRRPEDIAPCVEISIEILEQFMEFEPLHFKNFCVS